jgi:hypothetical protein
MTSDLSATTGGLPDNVAQYMQNAPSYLEGQAIPNFDAAGNPIQSSPFLTTVADERNILEKAGDWLTSGGKSQAELTQAGTDAAKEAYKKVVTDYTAAAAAAGTPINPVELQRAAFAAGEAARKTASSVGYAAKYGPMALAGAGAAYAGGMFDPPEEEEATAADLEFGSILSEPNPLFAADPGKFKIPVNPFQFQTASNPFVPTRFAADGGMINGPGTGTSDSIPGWLSDGEFVFTERAVRGADPTGQGRRQAGANNMYNIMRNFEMSA